MTARVSRPRAGDHAPYYSRYVDLVPDGDIIDQLERQGMQTHALLHRVSEKQSLSRYEEGKWSVREVIGHVSDAERVFSYRALTFARGDAVALPGYDQDLWAKTTNANERTMADLTAELASIRASTVALLRSFGPAEFARGGTASENHVTVGALVWIIAGHELHHVKVLREQYGLK